MSESVTAVGGPIACFALLLIPFLAVLGLTVLAVMRNRDQWPDISKAFASRHRLAYRPGPDPELHGKLPDFALFGPGTNGLSRNIIIGRLAIGARTLDVIIGDYACRTGSEGVRKDLAISYIAVRLPWNGMPRIMIRPERFVERPVPVPGIEEIDIGPPDFSRRFEITASDGRFARELLDEGMVRFLLASDPPDLIELNDGVACIGGTWAESGDGAIESRLAWIGEFLDRWPGHLVRSLEDAAQP